MALRNSLRDRRGLAIKLFAALTLATLIAWYLWARANYALCEVAEPRMILGPSGQSIKMDTRFCSPLTGDPGTIVVRLRPYGSTRGTIIFAYNPTGLEPDAHNSPWYPEIVWNGPNSVLISISRISQIQRQRHELGAVHFIYRIGKVDYPTAQIRR